MIAHIAFYKLQPEVDAERLENMVRVCYQRGPILRAVSDAAPMDERLEKSWTQFVKGFDDAVTQRIEQQQAAGLGPEVQAVGDVPDEGPVGFDLRHWRRGEQVAVCRC